MGVFQRSELLHKIIHHISLWWPTSLTIISGLASLLLVLSLPLQRSPHLHRDKRSAERLEPGRDAPQRLPLPSSFLVFSRTEVGLAPSRARSDRRAAIGLYVQDVGLERERVNKLVVVVVCAFAQYVTHVEIGQICFSGVCGEGSPFAAWTVGRLLTYAFTLSGRGWMLGGRSTCKRGCIGGKNGDEEFV